MKLTQNSWKISHSKSEPLLQQQWDTFPMDEMNEHGCIYS